jgi:TrmH family RNA methyltransferase
VITSLANERVRWVRRLAGDRKARRREGVWIAEGLRLAEEVLRSPVRVRLWVIEEGLDRASARAVSVCRTIERSGHDVLAVKRGLLCEIADTRHPQGVVAVLDAPGWEPAQAAEGPGPVVILDRLQDPGNLGTIARSAEAAAASGLLLAPGATEPGNPKALRASAGSLLRLPAAVAQDPIAVVRAAGLRVLVAARSEGEPYDRADLTGRFALLLGQEGAGVAPGLARGASGAITIPMQGAVESLNVAAAAAVVLFEAARQRRALGDPVENGRDLQPG